MRLDFRWSVALWNGLWRWLCQEVWPNFLDTFSRRGGVSGRPYFEGRAFHVEPFTFAAVQVTSSGVPFLLLMLHSPAHLQGWVLGLFGFKITVGTFLMAIIVSRYQPVVVNERGLRARNLLGEARRLEWSQIRAVRATRWLGIAPMLRISSLSRPNVIWLPLYLKNRANFESYMREVVPHGNVLREFFEPKP